MVTNVRNADAMRSRILKGLGRIIVRDGLAAVGVNALAREAECDKVLIYRYFGNLDGVYEAFAARGDFWWSLPELIGDVDPTRMSASTAMKLILRRYSQAIRSRPITLAVLASETTERTKLVVALEKVRERRSLELLAWISDNFRLPAGMAFDVVSMILGVAINYLSVRGRSVRVMNGVPIRTDADWERLHAAIDRIVDRVMRG